MVAIAIGQALCTSPQNGSTLRKGSGDALKRGSFMARGVGNLLQQRVTERAGRVSEDVLCRPNRGMPGSRLTPLEVKTAT